MFIYEIVNKVNGKKYIGQAQDYDKRWKEHIYRFNTQIHENQYFQAAWNKYGQRNFSFRVIQVCTSQEELDQAEIEWIKTENTRNRDFGYNTMPGGGKTNAYEIRKARSKTLRPDGYSDVVNEFGTVFKIENLREFARQHNLTQPGLRQVVVTKKYFHYKGWRLATSETIGIPFDDKNFKERGNRISKVKLKTRYPNVLSPNGTIYSVEQLSQFCREHKLSKSNISMLLRRKKESYKGWTLAPD
jgi:group I intron endonuclease